MQKKYQQVATSTDGSEVPPTEKWVTAEAAKAFSDAIAAAKAVLADEAATQAEVNEAVTALGNAVTAYTNAQKAGTKEVGNREALATAISDAEKVPTVATSTDGSEVPTTEKWVTAEAATAFSDAIAEAKAVLADEAATQAEVNEAVTALGNAVTAYTNAQKAGTKTKFTYSVGSGADANEIVLTFSESIGSNGTIVLTNKDGTVADAKATISSDGTTDGLVLTVSSTKGAQDGETVIIPLTIDGKSVEVTLTWDGTNEAWTLSTNPANVFVDVTPQKK